ncbi:MAG: hypothetical protein P4L31_01135 [Candidatus Babeliales bacterium]|nr:hypothetical protein [Candidatus Babeliales bacterium]
MFKNRILFISMLTLSFVRANADSVQSIEVLNDSAQFIKWAANNADNSFVVSQLVPAYSKAFVIAQVTQLSVVQDRLFAGIFRNSPEEIKQAITAGANVNKAREGKSPLAWALSFNMVNAAACLLQYGAK